MNYNYRPIYPNELYHYGIPGMQWGVRRYQNEDGSYTNAGKERYAETVASRSNMDRPNALFRNASNIASTSTFRISNNDSTLAWHFNPKGKTTDRVLEWLTGNGHENGLKMVQDSRDDAANLLRTQYGYSYDEVKYYETLIDNSLSSGYEDKEILDALNQINKDKDERYVLTEYYTSIITGAKVVDDYKKHTLPGIIDTILEPGRKAVSKMLEWLFN